MHLSKEPATYKSLISEGAGVAAVTTWMRGVLVARVPYFRGRRAGLVLLLHHHPFVTLLLPSAFHLAHQFAEYQGVEPSPSLPMFA